MLNRPQYSTFRKKIIVEPYCYEAVDKVNPQHKLLRICILILDAYYDVIKSDRPW